MDKTDPIATARELIAGFVVEQPLTRQEQELIHPVAMGRLCQSVVMSSYSYSCDPTCASRSQFIGAGQNSFRLICRPFLTAETSTFLLPLGPAGL